MMSHSSQGTTTTWTAVDITKVPSPGKLWVVGDNRLNRQWSSGQETKSLNFVLIHSGILSASACKSKLWLKHINSRFDVGHISYRDMQSQRDPPFLSELGTVGETLCWSIPKLLKSPSTQMRPPKTNKKNNQKMLSKITMKKINQVMNGSWCNVCPMSGDSRDSGDWGPARDALQLTRIDALKHLWKVDHLYSQVKVTRFVSHEIPWFCTDFPRSADFVNWWNHKKSM